MIKDDSILNQIMADNQQKSLSDLSLAEAVEKLLSLLNKREQEVLRSRFGLGGTPKETLEAIGKKLELTRERIRQIETSSVTKLKKARDNDSSIVRARQLITQLIEEHSGLADKNYLFDILRHLSSNNDLSKEDHDHYAEFALNRLFDDYFEPVKGSKYFPNSVKVRFAEIDHLESLAEELLSSVQNLKRLMATEELISNIKDLETFKTCQEKMTANDNPELKRILSQVIPDFSDEVYSQRGLYSLLRAVDGLEQNRFNQWGYKNWREVSPKTINDKIYLVLKNECKPMYYGDIAKKIAELGFDGKGVNVATTHNELILDDKYVLVGRGLYGLKEWGYQSGTVADVISAILAETGEPLSKDEIVEKVLKQRLVKQTTINLALMNKNKFIRTTDGKYTLANQ